MIIYCCQDLIFATKIRSTAEATGASSRPARSSETLDQRLNQVDDGKLNEPVTAVFIDLDLDQTALAFIEQVKAHDSNHPVVAFGSHVATVLLQAAHDRGADFVMTRGQFTANLPTILQRFGGNDV